MQTPWDYITPPPQKPFKKTTYRGVRIFSFPKRCRLGWFWPPTGLTPWCSLWLPFRQRFAPVGSLPCSASLATGPMQKQQLGLQEGLGKKKKKLTLEPWAGLLRWVFDLVCKHEKTGLFGLLVGLLNLPCYPTTAPSLEQASMLCFQKVILKGLQKGFCIRIPVGKGNSPSPDVPPWVT